LNLSDTAQDLIRREIIRHHITHGLHTNLDVQEFLLALKEPKIGTKHNCAQQDHCAQFDVVADMLTGRVESGVVWTNRAGSKTYLFGGLDTWYKACYNKKYETRLLGGSENQSMLSYKAMDDFWRISGLEEELLGRESRGGRLRKMLSKTEWQNGSEVSILTASQKSVRGPHPQCLKLDEVDEIDDDVYQAALSQPVSKYGHNSSLWLFSTNRNIGWTMDRALAKSKEQNTAIYKYCCWEILAACKDYSCSTCPLTPWCPGPHMKQADGYYPVKDLIQKLQTLSMSVLMREWFCIKVGFGDLVYEEEWDEERHVKGMPKFNAALPVTLSIDWGGVNPFSVGVWQYFQDIARWVRVAEVFLSPVGRPATNHILLSICKQKSWWKNITQYTADPARADLIAEWEDTFYAENRNIAFHPHEDRDVDTGVEAVKNALHPVLGSPKIGVHYSCLDNRREYTQYRRKKINEFESKIVKESDHTMDDTRLFVCQFIRETGGGAFMTDDNVDVTPE